MFNPTYLQLSRNGIYYLRWPIPRQLHPAQRATTIRLSLRTRDPKAALRMSRSVSQMADCVVESGSKVGMRYDDIRKLLTEHFRSMLERRKAEIAASGRLSNLDRQTYANGAGLSDIAIEADDVQRFIQKYGLKVEEGTASYRWLEQEIRASYKSFNKAVLQHDAALDEYDFSSTPTPAPPVTPSPAPRMSIAGLAEAYEAERMRAGQWGPKTRMEKADHLALLKELFGPETDIASLGPMDGKRIKETLFAYPKHRNKNPETRGKTLESVLAIAGTEKISVVTLNKYLQTYADMFELAKRNGHIADNTFSKLTVRQNRRHAVGKRSPFTDQQIQTIIRAVTAPEGLAHKDYQKWGPLMGIYSGARLNEIAQLHVTDVRQEDGIWCFDLNDDDDGKRLKAAASRRIVPIHSALIKLGVLEFVDQRSELQEKRLFPGFTYCPKNGWGRHLGRWFNGQLLPKLDLKRPDLVFHSLRHTVVHNLMRADVPEPIVKALVGHAQEGVTQQHYFTQGYRISQLRDALENLTFSEAQPSTGQ